MFNVQINKGTFRGNHFAGKYMATKTWFPDSVPDHESHLGDGKVFVMVDGKERGIWVFKDDVEIEGMETSPLTTVETVDEMKARINKRFKVMDMMTDGIISGKIRSLIISGAAGIGKTYSLDKALTNAHGNREINYKSINGKISGVGLYEQLWLNRKSNSVLLIDDVDVFSDMDILNVLKAALDTGDVRTVCWSTASTYLEEHKIDKKFEFEGTVVFITNVDVDKELERGSKLAPHLQALVSRSVYLDLGVHSNEEIMIRVEDVILNTTMMQDRGLSHGQTHMALNWLKANVANLRNVSLRTALYLADFIVTDSNDWEEIAEVTLLK